MNNSIVESNSLDVLETLTPRERKEIGILSPQELKEFGRIAVSSANLDRPAERPCPKRSHYRSNPIPEGCYKVVIEWALKQSAPFDFYRVHDHLVQHYPIVPRRTACLCTNLSKRGDFIRVRKADHRHSTLWIHKDKYDQWDKVTGLDAKFPPGVRAGSKRKPRARKSKQQGERL